MPDDQIFTVWKERKLKPANVQAYRRALATGDCQLGTELTLDEVAMLEDLGVGAGNFNGHGYRGTVFMIADDLEGAHANDRGP